MSAKIPAWARTMLAKYDAGIAHMFTLHFNVADYAAGKMGMKAYLAKLWMAKGKEIVAYYDRASGITFALESMKEKALKLLGLDQQPDEALAALQAVGGAPPGGVSLPRSPGQALPLLERLLRAEDADGNPVGVAVIVEFAEAIAPEGDFGAMSPEDRDSVITLQKWARDPGLANRGNPVILLTSNLTDLHSAIRAASSRTETILVPLPDLEERLEFIKGLLEDTDGAEPPRLEGMTPEQFAATTAGLSRVNIEDIELRAAELKQPISRDLVRERKKEIVSSEFGDVIEIMEPAFGFEAIGGLEHVKRFMMDEVVNPIRVGRLTEVPMGIGFLGPPGTGKTAIMQAGARESGFNAVVLNLGKILGQYVGSSERNLEKALKAIDALRPVFVFIDEVDQAGIGRGQQGDSGVGNRLFKRLLEYISDTSHRGQVVFFMASNRPDLMDAALKRPGRLDAKIPFVVPEDTEREAIFKAIATKYGIGLKVPAWGEIVAKTKGYTGAEIESIVIKARRVAQKAGRSEVTLEDLQHAVWAIAPSTGEIEFQTLLAIRECNDKDLLPPAYQAKLDNRESLSAEIDKFEERLEASGRRSRR